MTSAVAVNKAEVADRLAALYKEWGATDARFEGEVDKLIGVLTSNSNGHVAAAAVPAASSSASNGESHKASTRNRPKRLPGKVGRKWALPPDGTLENGIAVFPSMGRGRKQCPNETCKRIIGARSPRCVCGWDFKEKKMGPPPVPSAEAVDLGEPIMQILKICKNGVDLPSMMRKLLEKGIVVQNTKDIENKLKEFEADKKVTLDEKTRKWMKVA